MEEKKKFILKMILFLLSSLVIPCVYLGLRFKLFETKTTISLSLWAVIAFALVLGVVAVMIKYYLSGLKTKYSYLKQVLDGLVKVIFPITLVLALVIVLKVNSEKIVANLGLVIEVLCIILGCETLAVLVNPLPKWAFDNNVDGLAEITDKILSKKGE